MLNAGHSMWDVCMYVCMAEFLGFKHFWFFLALGNGNVLDEDFRKFEESVSGMTKANSTFGNINSIGFQKI